MSSNLPPGCSQNDIPGCRPMDIAVDKAIEAKECGACKHYNSDAEDEALACNFCHKHSRFEVNEDHARIVENIQIEAEAKRIEGW